MGSLRLKLLIGFVTVALVAVIVVALAATRATNIAFVTYVHQGQMLRLERIQAELVDYYTRNRSWTGVQSVLEIGGGRGMGRMMGPTMGMGHGQTMMDPQTTIVADAQGVIVAAVGTPHDGPRLTAREIAAALPIVVDGQTVGYVLGQGAGLASFSILEQQFLASVNQAFLLASLIAGGLAIVIGLVIARHLTAPLLSMTQAAQAMARGDLTQRVKVNSSDEVGRLAEAFNTMAASLARAEELRRNLVADVAHELRTPLAVLRADLEALQDGIYEPTPERLAILREETDLLARLVTDLHELSLAEAGQLTLERQPTNVTHLCQQTVAAMAPQAAAQQVHLVMGLADEDAISMVDPNRISQVLRNLVSNALRYTPPGGKVTLSCRTDGNDVFLSVSDTGSGIKPEDLPYVFDRFYRSEKSRSRATGGAGLGLAIVKQLVEAHGGQVWVESTPGQGTTFFIRLPKYSGSTP